MGIGCRRDPLEANAFYVRAADQGDERAKFRIAAIREAASGGPPVESSKKMRKGSSGGNVAGKLAPPVPALWT
jgi:TPR repeat protein